jgi:hypothetical protein
MAANDDPVQFGGDETTLGPLFSGPRSSLPTSRRGRGERSCRSWGQGRYPRAVVRRRGFWVKIADLVHDSFLLIHRSFLEESMAVFFDS